MSTSQSPLCAGHFCDCGRGRGMSAPRSPDFIPATPTPAIRLTLPPPPRLQRQGAIRSETPDASPIYAASPIPTHTFYTGTLEAESDTESEVTYSDMPPLVPAPPVNRHLYFDDAGNEISREEYVAQNWSIKLPKLSNKMVARHPRVLLAFFEFIDRYNEVAKGEEIYMMPALPKSVVDEIYEHPSFQHPRAFPYAIGLLEEHISRHSDLSE